MKTYAVFVHEVHIQEVRVEAESEEAAKERVAEGEGDYVDNALEYSYSLEPETWRATVVEGEGPSEGVDAAGHSEER